MSSRLKIPDADPNHMRLFSEKGEELFPFDKLTSGSVVYLSLGEDYLFPGPSTPGTPLPPSLPSTPSTDSITPKSDLPGAHTHSSYAHSPPVVPSPGPPAPAAHLPPPISRLPPPIQTEEGEEEGGYEEYDKEENHDEGHSYEDQRKIRFGGQNKTEIVSSSEAQEIRFSKEKKSRAEDHQYFCMSFLDKKTDAHVLFVFNAPTLSLDIYKHNKPTKDSALPSYPIHDKSFDFSGISSFQSQQQAAPEKGAPSQVTITLFNGSNALYYFRLMHPCQLDPLSEILRCITDGNDVLEFFQTRPKLCLKKGVATVRSKKEKIEKKVYLVITVRTLALYLEQTDAVPIFSIPLTICELNKLDKSLHIQAIGQQSIPSIHFVFDYNETTFGMKEADIQQRRDRERDVWYQAMRKATRIGPDEVATVIELQNDIVAHYGLPFEKARLPSISLLRKLWSFVETKEEFNEENFASPHWKDLGFQGNNPFSDLKRVGILGLRHLSYFSERWPEFVKEKILMSHDKKTIGKRYDLALVGVLVTDLLTSLVGLHPNREGHIAKFPSSFPMFFHHALNPKMFDELFCWSMHVFDLLWDESNVCRVGSVMGLLKERLGVKLKQPPVHGGFEMLFLEENKVLKTRIAKRSDLVKTRETLVDLYPQLAHHLVASDVYLVMAINKASPHSISQQLAIRIQKLFLKNDCLIYNLLVLLELEIDATLGGTTLFRENNICTYMLTTFTRDLAKSSGYLHDVIVPTVHELINSGKSFDFSGRNKESREVIAENQDNVIYFVEKFFNSIIGSFDTMPIEFRMIAHVLQASVLKKFPECRHSVVGSFLFLRLLCPLIVTPLVEWGGIPDPIPINQKKGLVLMSKVLQNLSNGTYLRETNTDFVNKWLNLNSSKLQEFFDKVAEKLPDNMMPVKPPNNPPEEVEMEFDDILHIHSFLHSHLLQVDEAIRTQLPQAISRLQELVLLLVKLPSGIEPLLETSS